MKTITRELGFCLLAAVLSAAMIVPAHGANPEDSPVQVAATKALSEKKEFRSVNATVEDRIVTLTGSVDLYQQKLDAAKKVRKLANVDGVRNLISVDGPTVSDNDLARKLAPGLYYDRMGYDIAFNYITASVQNGVITLGGATRTDVDHDYALALVGNTPGVKDVIDNISVAPVSQFDDRIRLSAMRAIYRDPVLERYAIDPARPIRIVVANGKLTLYGTVANSMDKQIAGVKAAQVFGAFTVTNNLEVAKKS